MSAFTAQQWAHVVTSDVVHNGIDLQRWTPGLGGGPALWSGRMVPEKAPHIAIRAARSAGVPLDLLGPIADRDYFERMIRPELDDTVRYLGHARHDDLVEHIGAASVTVVTPDWDEPYGLVVAESLACGTPVAGIARGALPEIVDDRSGCLAPPGDEAALVEAIRRALTLNRADVRRRAEEFCDMEQMVRTYETLYQRSAHLTAA